MRSSVMSEYHPLRTSSQSPIALSSSQPIAVVSALLSGIRWALCLEKNALRIAHATAPIARLIRDYLPSRGCTGSNWTHYLPVALHPLLRRQTSDGTSSILLSTYRV